MIILRQSLYGKSEEKDKKENLKTAASLAGIYELTKGGLISRGIDEIQKKKRKESEVDGLLPKLHEQVSKRYRKIAYNIPKNLEEENKDLLDKLKKKEEIPEIIDDAEEYIEKTSKKKLTKEQIKRRAKKLENENHYNPNKDKIFISTKNSGVLAHEIGHSMSKKERAGGTSGKILDKIRDKEGEIDKKLTGITHSSIRLGNIAVISTGAASGYKAGRNIEEDKKTSLGNKLAPGIAAVAVQTPTLGSEITASHRGIKMLKEAGASKEYLKYAKKGYRTALGTYALPVAGLAASGYGAREVGKVVGRIDGKIHRLRKYEDQNKNT